MTLFAILLPLTSRNTKEWKTNLMNLRETLALNSLVDQNLFVGIDKGDPVYDTNEGESLVRSIFAEVCPVSEYLRFQSSGRICDIWRKLAHTAYVDSHADYYLLLGDDIQILEPEWGRIIDNTFAKMCSNQNCPMGFGCVALRDCTFKGFPTFPIVHRIHMDIFQGTIFPSTFINQDADPFLFELYRKWGCSLFADVSITNDVGGAGNARYDKEHVDWKNELLLQNRQVIREWLDASGSAKPKEKLLLDVITPTYRCDIRYLERIVKLPVPESVSTMFLVIVDNPKHPDVGKIMALEGDAERNIRVRVLPSNMGASEARNRGIGESSAEYLMFLDDDVIPDSSIIMGYADAIIHNPQACGFVGVTKFPCPYTIRTLAVRLSGVTFFWDASKFLAQLPWGVTANLCTRRVPNCYFSNQFPKTGGGEDIDYCLKVSQKCGIFLPARKARAMHPWWNDGVPDFWHFHNWAMGDGYLQFIHPQYSYWNWPNVVEFTVLLLCLIPFIAPSLIFVIFALVGVWIFEILCDIHKHLSQGISEHKLIHSWSIALAIILSTFVKNLTELGHLQRNLSQCAIFIRFDWFCGLDRNVIIGERKQAFQRFLIWNIWILGLLIFYPFK